MVRILNFGAFVELAPGKDGMVHISKLAERRVEKVEDVVNIGDMVWVKVTDIDERAGESPLRDAQRKSPPWKPDAKNIKIDGSTSPLIAFKKPRWGGGWGPAAPPRLLLGPATRGKDPPPPLPRPPPCWWGAFSAGEALLAISLLYCRGRTTTGPGPAAGEVCAGSARHPSHTFVAGADNPRA